MAAPNFSSLAALEVTEKFVRGVGWWGAAFVVGSPKGDLGHLGDLLPQIGLLKVTFLFKSLLSERKDDGGVLHTLFAMHRLSYIIYDMIPYLFNNH